MEKLLSLVVPAFNEEEAMEQSFERTCRAMSSIGYPFEIIYIDDGSRDRTWEIISRLAREHEEVKALRFSRNFGHQLAVTAGMDEAKGDAVIIMDADLQDPPEVIADMVKAWEQGADIAYGKRMHRKGETAAKKFTAWCYYRLLNFMSAYPIPLDTGDFRLLDKAVADEFKVLREHNRFLRGMSAWLGYNAVPVEYVREERCAGKTKYTLKKMLRLAADGIFGFSSRPLTLIGWAGLAVLCIALLGLIATIACAAVTGVPGWIWAVCALVLLDGVILCAMGVQGAYTQRIYDEVKGRPLYIIKERQS
ncbi:MAG: glycosyltransferase family 2 protein [Christensenellales bacterium]|nr:glycosyltransferase family 2 protein [Christensenellaceae bacterium]